MSCGACADYTPEAVQEITGNPAAELERAAHIYGEAASGSLLWGLGVTEHKYGSEVVQLLCNLAMMTGKVGKAGSALLPLRGQNNVQGSSDMGALPDPDTAHVVAALENLEFVVCQEIFENETTKYADVVLPASAFLEKSGTFINAERPFQAVEPAIDPPGGARTDFDIITTVSRMLGHEMGWQTPWDALDEIARLTPTYAGVSRERRGRRGLQWPVRPDGGDSPTLYDTTFDNLTGKGQFAARLWITDGDKVSIRSRVGQTELYAKVTDRIERGHVFTSFHFPEARTNLLVGQSADVNTSCPEYKVIGRRRSVRCPTSRPSRRS